MALFRVVATPNDLPKIGEGRERGTFDFKGKVDASNQRELGKDVAAFANALGGVVVAGAHEDKKTGTLGRYEPMELAAAEKLKGAYELAVTQRCQPQPVIDVVRIEKDGGHVVAVNVYASSLAPIGVRWDADRTGPSFAFPLRTATQTHFMSPTELAMLMVPAVRRVAILLDSIPLDQRREVLLRARAISGAVDGEAKMTAFVGLDDALTTAAFQFPDGGGHMKLRVPIDAIRSIWMADDDHWIVSIAGALVRGPAPDRYWYYHPL